MCSLDVRLRVSLSLFLSGHWTGWGRATSSSRLDVAQDVRSSHSCPTYANDGARRRTNTCCKLQPDGLAVAAVRRHKMETRPSWPLGEALRVYVCVCVSASMCDSDCDWPLAIARHRAERVGPLCRLEISRGHIRATSMPRLTGSIRLDYVI